MKAKKPKQNNNQRPYEMLHNCKTNVSLEQSKIQTLTVRTFSVSVHFPVTVSGVVCVCRSICHTAEDEMRGSQLVEICTPLQLELQNRDPGGKSNDPQVQVVSSFLLKTHFCL